MKKFRSILIFCCLYLISLNLFAVVNVPLPGLHVEGRNLKDTHGNTVILHGFAQTYSPYFNEFGKYWNNYDVVNCLKYNKAKIDSIIAAGWQVNFIRLHMDPYWSNTPGIPVNGENDISAFSFTRFKTYLDQVFIPMVDYANSKGLYVIMRPPGVCPEKIAVNDAYNKYLLTIWGYVSQHAKLRNNAGVMYELANEPVTILGTDGTYGSNSQGDFDNLKTFFQAVVDTIRNNGSRNILWIPGLAYQSSYKGFAVNPIEGDNIGYAVHIYPGWFGSGSGYAAFQSGWDTDIKPVANFAPICVTEMDWAPAKYNASWGKDSTGVAGGTGFGANFKKITDASGNVSWLLFTDPSKLARFTGIPPAVGDTVTFLNDPQACPLPCFNWYKDYAKLNYPRPDFTKQSHSDNGNGTYSNPLIFGDFPDPDVIRVGDTYYMVTTSMFVFPGATLLKSKDLVNWEYCANPLEKIENSACYNLDGCSRYGAGQWASSLKYKNGKFYLLFNTNNEGNYLMTATDPEGLWTITHLSSGFYDPGLFFDDNAKIYVVSGIGNIRINELDANFKAIDAGQLVFTGTQSGLEGNHLYKINGYYYIYSTYGGLSASQVAIRSQNIYGPYEQKILYTGGSINNIHQGALIETQTGQWWTIMFDDRGAFGRLLNLQPVSWVDDWPVIGNNGVSVSTYTKPDVGRAYPITSLPTNDNFRNYKLDKQWGWNHNSDNSNWSLIERPNYLRLRTANVTDSLLGARNTLTQRVLGYYTVGADSYGTISISINKMLNGDVAGLSLFTSPNPCIAVKVIDGQKRIVRFNNKTTLTLGPVVTDSVVYLRIVANYTNNIANFYYSTDNITFTKLGNQISLYYDFVKFVGIKFALFNYATIQTGGYVDVDWFSTEANFTEDTFFDSSFTGYSADALTMTNLQVQGGSDIDLITGASRSFALIATYADGHTSDVTLLATYNNPSPDIVTVINGQIITKQMGTAQITATYKAALGDARTVQINVNSSVFPFSAGSFNPSIYSTGNYDTATRSLTTGQYGFGGWVYNSGVDLSKYKYLVVKLASTNSCGASFRIFDENNYWTGCAQYNFGSTKEVIVTLSNMVRYGTTTKLDPSHLYIIGFWSYGGCPINIADVYVTNNSDYSKPTALEEVVYDENSIVDVYSISGVRLYSRVKRAEIIKTMKEGIYIVGNQKMAISNKNE